jgi:hypothetical protein
MKQWETGRSQTPLPPERRAEVLRPLIGLTVRAGALGTRGHSPQAAALASPDITDLSCTRARPGSLPASHCVPQASPTS